MSSRSDVLRDECFVAWQGIQKGRKKMRMLDRILMERIDNRENPKRLALTFELWRQLVKRCVAIRANGGEKAWQRLRQTALRKYFIAWNQYAVVHAPVWVGETDYVGEVFRHVEGRLREGTTTGGGEIAIDTRHPETLLNGRMFYAGS